MTTYDEIKDFDMAVATGDDSGGGSGLTDWRNGKAAFIAGELIPCDLPLKWDFKPIPKKTQEIGSMTTSRVRKRVEVGREIGRWTSTHAFQTAQFCYWVMGTCSTTEGTPAGYNTHAITIDSSSTPNWHGIHFERNGITSNEKRYDIAGILTERLEINCGPQQPDFPATQTISCLYAWDKTDASNITAQTPRPFNTIGTKWKTWNDLVSGNGAGNAASATGLTYNSNQLEVDVKHFKAILERETYMGGIPDTDGYFQQGLMQSFKFSYQLDVHPTGDLLFTVNNTNKEDYAGDLDYDFKFDADTTNDNIRFNNDKLYLVPFDEVNDWNKYIEGYTITLEPYDTSSSLTVTGIDGLNNNHYENP